MTDEEKIAHGECVSSYTTDHCLICVDVCRAMRNKVELMNLLMVKCQCNKPLPYGEDTHICRKCEGEIKPVKE